MSSASAEMICARMATRHFSGWHGAGVIYQCCMAQERTSLELLILALVGRGLETTYDLNVRAAISVGAALPALQRLSKAGLVKGTPGTRRSRRFSLTPRGEAVLHHASQKIAREIPADFESILRVAFLLWLGSSKAPVQAFLRRAAEERARLAQGADREALAYGSQAGDLARGAGHRWMKAFTAAERLRAESKVLRRLAAKIPTMVQ